MIPFVPWGELAWLLLRLEVEEWAFFGCIAHEERWLSAWRSGSGRRLTPTFVRIFDADPLSATEEKESLDRQTVLAKAAGVPEDRVFDAGLLATIDQIEKILETATEGVKSVIVDITSLPKRWFFVIARLLKETDIDNIVFTYSLGDKYADVLSSNPEIVRALPTFTSMDRRSICDVAFVGIGYHGQSVLNLFDFERPKSVAMLFPFPPGPPGISRNWKFVQKLERAIKPQTVPDGEVSRGTGISHVHLAALDLPQNFAALRKLTADGAKTSLIAPYGPKPVSLAMCLFALAAQKAGKPEVPAYYSQPTRYSLDYTVGTKKSGGASTVYGYPLRLRGRDLYNVT